MRKALYIFGHLTDADLSWLARVGRRRALSAGEMLVRQGVAITFLYITLEGVLSVRSAPGGEVARLSAGEVIGEISFVDSSPPSADVVALGPAMVLEIPRLLLSDRLTSDSGFAGRFYRALAIFLATRLRATVAHMGYGAARSDDGKGDTLTDDVLDHVSEAGERFLRLLTSA